MTKNSFSFLQYLNLLLSNRLPSLPLNYLLPPLYNLSHLFLYLHYLNLFFFPHFRYHLLSIFSIPPIYITPLGIQLFWHTLPLFIIIHLSFLSIKLCTINRFHEPQTPPGGDPLLQDDNDDDSDDENIPEPCVPDICEVAKVITTPRMVSHILYCVYMLPFRLTKLQIFTLLINYL